jgi:hypothetical protein
MFMNREEEPDLARDAFREFALACRAERDRLARAQLAEQDRRFESIRSERELADREAARLIAAVSR